MAKDITVTIDLSEDLLAALGRAARRQGARPADYLRQLMHVALDLPVPARRRRDEAVRIALAEAGDWPDLQRRLRASGCVLRSIGLSGDLALCTWPLERPLLPLAALGISRADLALRLGSDFPPGGELRRRRTVREPMTFRTRRAA